MRPADANETSVGWRVALEREDGPVALLLSRQNIPVLDRAEVAGAEGLERGGYVLWDSAFDPAASGGRAQDAPPPQLILMASGAEVGTTLDAARMLASEGTRARVVSMPCMELFEAQPEAYREEVIPRAVRARLAVEPGARMSWWRWVGDGGDVLGLDRFGASAPGTTVLEKLGFTAENIAARARGLLDPGH
jgi:transketolase